MALAAVTLEVKVRVGPAFAYLAQVPATPRTIGLQDGDRLDLN